jgi:hypothetical protein
MAMLADHDNEVNSEQEPQGSGEEKDDEGGAEVRIDADDMDSIDANPPKIPGTDLVTMAIPSCRIPSTYVAHRAQMGLDRILNQFRLGDEQTAGIRGCFRHRFPRPGQSSAEGQPRIVGFHPKLNARKMP